MDLCVHVCAVCGYLYVCMRSACMNACTYVCVLCIWLCVGGYVCVWICAYMYV